MLALDAASRTRGRRGAAARALLARARPRPVGDEALAARVRKKLRATAHDPAAITVSIEHGCVDLRGPVETRERAKVVRAVARLPGVDAVLDLMTEPAKSPSTILVPRIELRDSAPTQVGSAPHDFVAGPASHPAQTRGPVSPSANGVQARRGAAENQLSSVRSTVRQRRVGEARRRSR
jgi:hypothetical protein